VQRQGDEIRITAQLIDAETGAHIWTERWDRPDADVFALQTEIVQQAANRIGVAGVIVEAQHKSAQSKRPENLNAYEKYLLAKDRVSRPSKERLDEAIVLFKQALEEDPTLARAWRDLAWAYDMSTWYEADYATAHPLAIEAARRAVALDPMDAGAHAALGVQIAYDGDFVRGKAALDTALRLNPGHADILALAASWSSTFGDPERGAALADKAIRINPNFGAPISTNFYTAYFMAGRYEDALHIIDRLPEENRTRYSRAIGASSYAALGQPEKAKAAVKEALEHHPELTAEGFANEPGFNDTERKKFAKLMIAAGFPACETVDKLAGLAKPFRLPECSATPAP
jgi:tetratricopeptide (TPR) repeat protein